MVSPGASRVARAAAGLDGAPFATRAAGRVVDVRCMRGTARWPWRARTLPPSPRQPRKALTMSHRRNPDPRPVDEYGARHAISCPMPPRTRPPAAYQRPGERPTTVPSRAWVRAVQHSLPDRLAWWVRACIGKTIAAAPRAPQRESEEAILAAWCWLRPGREGVVEPCDPDTALGPRSKHRPRKPALADCAASATTSDAPWSASGDSRDTPARTEGERT